MNREFLKNGFYDLVVKRLGYRPIMNEEESYRKVDNNELIEDIYGKGFLFSDGKLKLIWTEKFESGFEKYDKNFWIMVI